MYFTPGWAAILATCGTLAGVIVTQLANTAINRSNRSHERTRRVRSLIVEVDAAARGLHREIEFRALLKELIDLDKDPRGLRRPIYDASAELDRAISALTLEAQDKLVTYAAQKVRAAALELELAATRRDSDLAIDYAGQLLEHAETVATSSGVTLPAEFQEQYQKLRQVENSEDVCPTPETAAKSLDTSCKVLVHLGAKL
ncbi:hypothetical protein [Gordonia sp. (in: high G+C Gram-positive bacteria)]|uniref:hypothetical protein n=1 Tax=Gordonia sp. (in: high G+C Gram-positive bacteria) TaxID=84139 RepID=UPI00334213EB